MESNKYNFTTLVLGLISLLIVSSSVAANSYFWGQEATNSPVQIEIINDSGRALNQYASHRDNFNTKRTYLEAIKGKKYKLRIRNNSSKRIAVVIAVDGRNILNGKKSYLRSNEKMYVLNPYETSTYNGWRTSKNHVNRFYFTSAGGSYASAWGDHSAMGVIAVAVYDEKRKHYYEKHRKDFSSGRAAPSRRGYFSDDSTGTGFGHEEYSPTRKVKFKAKSTPKYKHIFKYEWKKTLCKRGIANCNYYENKKGNNRFWPKETYNRENSGYAPSPPDYYLKDGNLTRDFSINLDW